MRIRKNQKLFSSEEIVVCQLNQSPWDTIPIALLESYLSLNHQYERRPYRSFASNGSSTKSSMGARESVASVIHLDDNSSLKKKDDNIEIPTNFVDNNNDRSEAKKLKKKSEWPNLKKPAAVESSRRSGGPKKGTDANSHEYYYYSGFGPRWGKQRGGDKLISEMQPSPTKANGADNGTMVNILSENDKHSSSSASQVDIGENGGGCGYLFEDSECDEDCNNIQNAADGDNPKVKRVRKVKARSLKSLISS
ncbi:hypothetical protein ACFE04_018985 [Oxalis oulophora]